MSKRDFIPHKQCTVTSGACFTQGGCLADCRRKAHTYDHAARVAELEAKLAKAEAEAARLREDAERYRWIRSTTTPGYLCFPNGEIQDGLALGALDAAIDAARSARGEGVG